MPSFPIFEFWRLTGLFEALANWLKEPRNSEHSDNTGGVLLCFRHADLRPAHDEPPAEEAVCGRRKQNLGRKFARGGALPTELLQQQASISKTVLDRQDGICYAYAAEWGPKQHQLADFLQRPEYGREVVHSTCIKEEDFEGLFNTFVEGASPSSFYYGAEWVAPPALEQTSHYGRILDLLGSLNGIYGKMNHPPEDAFVIRGISAPLGTSGFGMHREEEHSYHLNFNFGPSPKLWLFVAAELEGKVCELGKKLFGRRWPKCGNPLGHISFFFSPAQLRRACIPYSMKLQRPGEGMLTVGLHSGVNLGPSICLVTEFHSPHAAQRFKEVGKWTRCNCRDREAYKLTRRQEREYLQLNMEAMSSERAQTAWRKYNESGKRPKPGPEQLAQLAAKKREQRARQKVEGHVVKKRVKEVDQPMNLDDIDLE